ncbi:MAG: cell division protein FtsZ [Flavobacteriaceae bacterium]
MVENTDFGGIAFDLPKNQSNVIKVIGVGGGGSNAINHMFKQGIKGVDFVVCNTDAQALQNSPVPNKIQLGVNLTEGLGAGANPEVGQQSAIESIADIEKMLDTNTKMVFITAGMGGGTGTGAAPVIAQLAKERDILTVGIVTMPFQFEGKNRIEQAALGIERLRKQVDSLIVINNNKLREVYGNLGFKAGFSKADEVLATASRGIAEVITHHYTQNIDLKDAKTVLSDSGTAIMGSAKATGEDRAKQAIVDALDSPLLNDNKITGAKNVLLLIVSGTNEITIDEIGEINDHIQAEAGHNANIIMGVGEDESLEEAIAVTVIATGFNAEQQSEIVNTEPKKIIHPLEDEQKLEQNLLKKEPISAFDFSENEAETDKTPAAEEEKIVFPLEEDKPQYEAETQNFIAEETSSIEAETQNFPIESEAPQTTAEEPQFEIYEADLVPTTEFIRNLDVVFEIVPANQKEFKPISEHKEERTPLFEPEEDSQPLFGFDSPLSKEEEEPKKKFTFEITSETKDIEVNEPIHVIPVTEVNETGVKRYSLEEYMEVENSLMSSKPVEEEKKTEEVPAELNFTLKQNEKKSNNVTEQKTSEEIPAVEMTIEEALRARADERRKKMKEFNYKFHNNTQRIDELEKEPAYKRQNIELNQPDSDSGISRTSLSTDSNNELQLRNNNSFLHDNVD